jgi:hypothetical protein
MPRRGLADIQWITWPDLFVKGSYQTLEERVLHEFAEPIFREGRPPMLCLIELCRTLRVPTLGPFESGGEEHSSGSETVAQRMASA